MSSQSVSVRPERHDDDAAVNHAINAAFGPGMRARAAHALREGVSHEMPLSFVAECGGEIVGSVRQTRIRIGGDIVLMLGPIGVVPARKNEGIGHQLMDAAVEAARKRQAEDGFDLIMLVGDLDYYGRFGFARPKPGTITLPRPVDPTRILVCELVQGAAARINGAARQVEVERVPTGDDDEDAERLRLSVPLVPTYPPKPAATGRDQGNRQTTAPA